MQNRFDLDRPVFGRLRLEHLLHLSILIVACVLRVTWLDHRPLHHDESIHAYYSWRILTIGAGDYRYDPVYHGPALYYLTALWQGLLGPSDFSARMLPVTTGLGLIALAWPLRTLIGRREAAVYALLLTLSPTIGYYSRSLRHDVPFAFFLLSGLVAFLHFLRSGRRRHAYLAGLSMGLAAATKEDIYLSAFLFANALWMVGLVPVEGSSGAAHRRLIEWARQVGVWLRREWMPLATAIIFALVAAVFLYTSLFTHPTGWNAPDRALRYWWGQQQVKRIGGPWWYYLPLEVGYEALIFLPALAWISASILRRAVSSRLEALLLVWTVLTFAIYAWAQEKVPWLLVPALVPQAVLAACYLANLSARRLAVAAPLAVLAVWSLVSSNYLYDAPRTTEDPASAHFEPIVYVQSTYDIRAVLGEIEAAAAKLGTATKTPMVVVGDATWPLSWYLRDYPVHWNTLPSETRAPILVVDPADAGRIQKDVGDRYEARRFAVRGWWQIDWAKMTIPTLVRFAINRRVWNPTGTTDAVMLVAKDLAPGVSLPAVRLSRTAPTRDYAAAPIGATGRTIGDQGTAPGRFSGPRGLAIDRDGHLLVADSQNNRVQRLSVDGAVLAVWGGPSPGDKPGEFRQPCGVAAGSDGSIYVADTWNHRIQKLAPDGGFVLEWRENEGGFWGPRAVAVSSSGTVYVADTGNKRVIAYDSLGRKMFSIGGEGADPGKLVEPVGLAIDEATKTLFVADTGNRRIQTFGLDGKLRMAWPVYGWQEFYTEPYLAFAAGALWITDSFNHRVSAYDSLGNLKRSVGGPTGPVPLDRPIGVAASAGRVYVSDFSAGRIAVLEGSAEVTAGSPPSTRR